MFKNYLKGQVQSGDLIVPEPLSAVHEPESLDEWGFDDTRFKVNKAGHVELTGKRYELCGSEMPHLFPWVKEAMGVEIDPQDVNQSNYPTQIPEPVTHAAFQTALSKGLQESQMLSDPKQRMRHGHGHTQYETFAIKYGELKRIPDLIVFPESEDDVVLLVKLAHDHDVCLIPFGGGTCVTEALLCPTNETRMIVSVDMKRLNRILWIDPVNRMACIEAGAVGRHIMQQLEEYGFTMGHEPDSVEFSTLGGWVATNASGMKKNKYGNIEDIVLDVNVVTSQGLLERSSVAPRESTGIDPRQWIFGSEGNLGIVTRAVVKLFPLPAVRRYGSILFPSFKKGYDFLYELMQNGKPPASIRLVDNTQFQFGQALKPGKSGFAAFKSKAEKFFVLNIKGFKPDEMVALTLVFEGHEHEVKQQESLVYGIAKKHQGMNAGSENGKRGYQLTYSIAYIRDFVLNHHVIAESFETSVPWSQTLNLCESVKKRIADEHEKRNLPGKPFVSCRITQLYDTGVAVYFYFGFYFKGVENASQIYSEIEEAAREEILKCGGSLSHHHGVGKLRKSFLKKIKSPTMLAWNQQMKKAVDPQNIFGANNQGVVELKADVKIKSA